MSGPEPYGPGYWAVSRYQARLLFFVPPEYDTLRRVKDRAEQVGRVPLKKVNWEKLHVLGLISVQRGRQAWVCVRQTPAWAEFWAELGVQPSGDPETQAAQLAEVDQIFGAGADRRLPLPVAGTCDPRGGRARSGTD
jgi:hypothetical protein